MLNTQMVQIIQDYPLGLVATITAEGRPAVSPKGTFFVTSATQIACAHIRSPKTIQNIQHHPHVEINFIDILTRQAVRIEASACYVRFDDAESLLKSAFRNIWADFEPITKGFMIFEIERAELIRTPSYDLGINRDQLVASYLDKITGYAYRKDK